MFLLELHTLAQANHYYALLNESIWHFRYSIILSSSAGFVGLFDAVLLLPLVVIWHFTGIEPFEVPSNSVWTLLLVNGFIGTVLSELFWLWWVCSSVSVCLANGLHNTTHTRNLTLILLKFINLQTFPDLPCFCYVVRIDNITWM